LKPTGNKSVFVTVTDYKNHVTLLEGKFPQINRKNFEKGEIEAVFGSDFKKLYDVKVGDTVIFYKAQNRKSSPRRRGPAKVLELDETGAAVYFQSQIFKVAHYCIRRRVKESEVVDKEPMELPADQVAEVLGMRVVVVLVEQEIHLL